MEGFYENYASNLLDFLVFIRPIDPFWKVKARCCTLTKTIVQYMVVLVPKGHRIS